MAKIIENIKSLGTKRLVAGAVAFILTAVMISSVAYFATRPDMTVLYSGLEPSEAGQAMSALEGMGIHVQAGNGGTSLLVPRADIDRARMSLAEKGLPSTPGIGYELFDRSDGFGLTTFMQRVNRLRAMEGELSRTIASLSGVDKARVHLVLPDRESFSRTVSEPSASVVVHMKGSLALDSNQARSIRHLVASAVPGLKPAAVTIADSKGDVIIADGEQKNIGNNNRVAIETKIQKSVEDILTARLGHGNVRVGVTAEIETAREVVRRQNFDPEGRVVRSTQTIEDRQQSSEGNADTPTTVQQNLPNSELLFGSSGAPAANSSDRTEETINYEISNEISERTIEPGDLRRISVAVLVNGIYEEGNNGERTYSERSSEEIESLEKLIKTAMGFNEARGDLVSVENLQFADIEINDFDSTLTTTELLAENSGTIAMWLIIALTVGLLFIFVIRPLMKLVTGDNQNNPTATAVIDDENPLTALGFGAPTDDTPPFQLNIGGEATEVSKEMLILSLHEAVDENPDEARAVLRAWIQESGI